MNKPQGREALTSYFENRREDYPPESAAEARAFLRNAENRGEPLPPANVYLALQNLIISEMGEKFNPKKRDRRAGRRKSNQRAHF